MTDTPNTLLLTDDELKTLNDVVRQSKVTASTEELLLIKLGKFNSPLLDVVFKIGVLWETRNNALQTPTPVVEVSDTPSDNILPLGSN